MKSGVKAFLNVFWDENFWLPPNVTWQDIQPGAHGINHADYKDLFWPIPIAMLLILLRFTLENVLFQPIGEHLKISNKKISPPIANAALEDNYRKMRKLSSEKLVELSKKLDMSTRDIDRWWRRRRAQDKATVMKKFCESCWKCVFYAFSFTFSLIVLWDQPYLWNILECARNYPHHAVSDGVWYYFMISISFYLASTIMHFFDARRKDFWQMLSHHVVTVMLMSFSWTCNFHRVGSLIMSLHDCADIFMEAAKALNYAKIKKLADPVFGTFVISWVVTRLGWFPRIYYGCLFQTRMPAYPAYFFLNSLMTILLFLHLFWTYLIYQMIEDTFKKGGLMKDSRSSSEDEDLSDTIHENYKMDKKI